jgi:hypothetical protein
MARSSGPTPHGRARPRRAMCESRGNGVFLSTGALLLLVLTLFTGAATLFVWVRLNHVDCHFATGAHADRLAAYNSFTRRRQSRTDGVGDDDADVADNDKSRGKNDDDDDNETKLSGGKAVWSTASASLPSLMSRLDAVRRSERAAFAAPLADFARVLLLQTNAYVDLATSASPQRAMQQLFRDIGGTAAPPLETSSPSSSSVSSPASPSPPPSSPSSSSPLSVGAYATALQSAVAAAMAAAAKQRRPRAPSKTNAKPVTTSVFDAAAAEFARVCAPPHLATHLLDAQRYSHRLRYCACLVQQTLPSSLSSLSSSSSSSSSSSELPLVCGIENSQPSKGAKKKKKKLKSSSVVDVNDGDACTSAAVALPSCKQCSLLTDAQIAKKIKKMTSSSSFSLSSSSCTNVDTSSSSSSSSSSLDKDGRLSKAARGRQLVRTWSGKGALSPDVVKADETAAAAKAKKSGKAVKAAPLRYDFLEKRRFKKNIDAALASDACYKPENNCRWCECSFDVHLCSLLCCFLGGASALVTFIRVLCHSPRANLTINVQLHTLQFSSGCWSIHGRRYRRLRRAQRRRRSPHCRPTGCLQWYVHSITYYLFLFVCFARALHCVCLPTVCLQWFLHSIFKCSKHLIVLRLDACSPFSSTHSSVLLTRFGNPFARYAPQLQHCRSDEKPLYGYRRSGGGGEWTKYSAPVTIQGEWVFVKCTFAVQG